MSLGALALGLVCACAQGATEKPRTSPTSSPTSKPPPSRPPFSQTERPGPTSPTSEEPYVFESRSGEKVSAFRGRLTVPENRSGTSTRAIELHYVRFPATTDTPGSPIVYLAGGPGGSGIATARRRRFPLFMAMRAFGDVIALDQRGTGWSTAAPDCPYEPRPVDRRVQKSEAVAHLRQAVETCEAFWRDAGHDPAGYTTLESARDLDALRVHLGASRLTLWGISYGTHLALAATKILGNRIDRMVLASVEGLDQTVKLPLRTDAYFDRLQAAIDTQPRAKAKHPDIAARMRRVHARLESDPVPLQLAFKDGPRPFLLTADVLQTVASASIADPGRAAGLLSLYAAADAGEYAGIAGLLVRYYPYLWPKKLPLMSFAMDIASGIGTARKRQVEQQAQTSLLGDVLNHPMPQLAGVMGLDLGDTFRAPPKSDVPTLVLSGTLDGRTYPRSQREAVAGLTNVRVITVVNAGHNLFMVSPRVTEAIERFMQDKLQKDLTIEVALPDFAPTPN